MNVPRQNLGLLVVLDALLQERGITQAATRLHLSQPAMSAAVARLREWLGDPLLVRAAGGYILTQRAESLADPLRDILENIAHTFQRPMDFNPGEATNTVRIAANDAFELLVLPRVVERLEQLAPRMRLVVESTDGMLPAQALARGEVDFGWGHFADTPTGIRAQVMMHDTLACLVRNDHPTIKKRLSLAQYGAATHIVVALKGNTLPAQVKSRLESLGLPLKVALQVPHLMAAPTIVANSNHIATLPRAIAQIYARMLNLRVLKIPFEFPGYPVSLVWHERAHRDPASIWLRAQISAVCQKL